MEKAKPPRYREGSDKSSSSRRLLVPNGRKQGSLWDEWPAQDRPPKGKQVPGMSALGHHTPSAHRSPHSKVLLS